MPTYEYACKACGHQFERRQSIKEDPIKDCPECGKPEASRMISQGNFILKGSGWYSDLYAGPSNKKADGESKADGAEAKSDGNGKGKGKDKAASSDGKSESKPADGKSSSGDKPSGSKGGESTSAS